MTDVIESLDKTSRGFKIAHDRISTAYHEAGHAVYALNHLMRVDSVKIYLDGYKRACGFTYYRFPEINNFEDESIIATIIDSCICINYAGFIAEQHLFNMISGSDVTPAFIREGMYKDNADAAKLFRKYNLVPAGAKRIKYKKKLRANILNELINNWEAVTIIAKHLYKFKKIEYDDLKKLLVKKSSIEYRNYWKYKFLTIDEIFHEDIPLDENDFKLTLVRHGFI